MATEMRSAESRMAAAISAIVLAATVFTYMSYMASFTSVDTVT